MKRRLKTNLMIVGIIGALLMVVPLLSCTTQAVPDTEPDTPNLPTTPTIPNTPTVPSAPTEPDNPTLPEITEPQPTPEPQAEVSQVNIVYFHRTNRCHSCQYSEAQTRATLDTYFADELASGKITFVSVDVQDESNAAIIEKYGAYGPQLFISVLKGDTESVSEVQEFWDFIDDDEGFSNLIIDKVNEALEAANL
jgi:hypothetical protein